MLSPSYELRADRGFGEGGMIDTIRFAPPALPDTLKSGNRATHSCQVMPQGKKLPLARPALFLGDEFLGSQVQL
jgi:hypothetical protein